MRAQDFFEGFPYESVVRYVNKIARSLQGMLTDRSLEYDDLVCQGMYAATNAFSKWDAAHNNDRADVCHLEAYVKINISGYMKNMFLTAKRRNQLLDDSSENSDEMGLSADMEMTSEDYNNFEDDSENIDGRSQRKYAKVFHAGNDEDSVAMMDVASMKVVEEEDARISALEAFVMTLSGIELDIMNNLLKRTDESIKVIASRYNVSTGCISRKCAKIKEDARDFIIGYIGDADDFQSLI